MVLTPNDPAMMYAPDLSKTIWNAAFGMGGEDYNRKMAMLRDRDRTEHEETISYWGIWDRYIAEIKAMDAAAKMKRGI
jgi:type IV secretion system protein VirD4